MYTYMYLYVYVYTVVQPGPRTERAGEGVKRKQSINANNKVQ